MASSAKKQSISQHPQQLFALGPRCLVPLLEEPCGPGRKPRRRRQVLAATVDDTGYGLPSRRRAHRPGLPGVWASRLPALDVDFLSADVERGGVQAPVIFVGIVCSILCDRRRRISCLLTPLCCQSAFRQACCNRVPGCVRSWPYTWASRIATSVAGHGRARPRLLASHVLLRKNSVIAWLLFF